MVQLSFRVVYENGYLFKLFYTFFQLTALTLYIKHSLQKLTSTDYVSLLEHVTKNVSCVNSLNIALNK